MPKLAEWHIYGNGEQGHFVTRKPENNQTIYYLGGVSPDFAEKLFSRILGLQFKPPLNPLLKIQEGKKKEKIQEGRKKVEIQEGIEREFMTALHNINILKDRRKDLRNNSTPAEKLLWSQLKNSQLEGEKFRRQHSVGFYILDFYCPGQKLCIELDGNQHFENDNIEYDLERTKYLESIGIKVLRFANTELYENIDAVLNKIKSTFSSPPEFLGGERGVV